MKIYRFFKNIDLLYYKIKWWIQTHTRGYSDSDTWNAGYAIAEKALPILKAYRTIIVNNELCSLPCTGEVDKEGYPECMDREVWIEILNDIIWSMEYLANDCFTEESLEKGYDRERVEKEDKKYKKGMALFAEYAATIWD